MALQALEGLGVFLPTADLLESVRKISPPSLGWLKRWGSESCSAAVAVSQRLFPWVGAWGETLGEDVGEALSFPRLQIRHPPGWEAEGGLCGHAHVYITEFICGD